MEETPLLGAISMIGIVVFTYYMHEAHWGCMDIVRQIAACLAAIILFELWPLTQKNGSYNQVWHQMLRAVIILAISIFSIQALSVYNDPVRIAARHSAGAYSFQRYTEDVETLANSIPADTLGIGQGISMIYHTLGWENHLQMQDSTLFLPFGAYEDVIAAVLEQDSFLICEYYGDTVMLEDILSRDSSYVKENEFQIDGRIYYYYERGK